MTEHWYALHSKPMKEALLWEQLTLHQIECYYPRINIQPVNPRSRKVRPYFPGYIFGHMDLEQTKMTMFQWLPGSSGLVGFDGIPSNIPDILIAAIRKRVDEINTERRELSDGLHAGDVVTIQAGPFTGYDAIFDARLSGSERVRVLLKLLNRKQLLLELPDIQIQHKKQ